MPRRARLSIAGIPWHIIQRGNNRSACFYADENYRRYLETLEEQAQKFDCALHVYVLMTNHVHLLLTPARTESAGLLMKHLGQRYVQYINRRYRRTATSTTTYSYDSLGRLSAKTQQVGTVTLTESYAYGVSAKDSAPLRPEWRDVYFMFQGNNASIFSSVSAAAMCCNTWCR